VAAKYAIPDPMTLTALTASGELAWTWLCGLAERWTHVFWSAGARGFTSGLARANVEPAVPLGYLDALREQNQDQIAALWSAIAPFEALRATRSGANNVSVVNEAMIQEDGSQTATSAHH
jgi:4-hydroxy-tetrahydrodipicolinate synthase